MITIPVLLCVKEARELCASSSTMSDSFGFFSLSSTFSFSHGLYERRGTELLEQKRRL